MDRFRFRAWNKDMNIMVYEDEDNSASYLDGMCKSDVQAVNEFLTYASFGNEYIWMQSTGLKDRNGKLIYEGDVVRTVHDTIGTIIYYMGQYDGPDSGKGSLAFFTIDEVGNNGRHNLRNINRVDEVIGNIYEHGNLLEK